MRCLFLGSISATLALILLLPRASLEVRARYSPHGILQREAPTHLFNCRRFCHYKNHTNCPFRSDCGRALQIPRGSPFRSNRSRLTSSDRVFPGFSKRTSIPRSNHQTNLDALSRQREIKKKKKGRVLSERKRRATSSRTDWKDVLHLYRFAPSGQCISKSNVTSEKLWTVPFNLPIFVQKVEVLFEQVLPVSNGAYFLLNLSNQSGPSPTLLLTKIDLGKSYLTTLSSFVVADFMGIIVPNTGDVSQCKEVRIAAALVHGQPVCPYGKWGPECHKDCPCPCHVVECHPVKGDCIRRGYACPSAKYGATCHKSCSPFCGGQPTECHVISADCKHCRNPNYTGVHCQSLIKPEEQEKRTAWCQRFTLQDNARLPSLTKPDQDMISMSSKGPAMTIGLSIIFVVVLFLVGCCVYIQMLRYCAKVRLVEHMTALEADRRRRLSMQSYSEFRREFYEMHEGKRSTTVVSDMSIRKESSSTRIADVADKYPPTKRTVSIHDPKL